ncbi:hypothetical protein U9M48_021958 [Paspalum notatum var. saurae]|uniref:Nuclease HARBI1 n=1 Tax=Paspalum notatum var. saurae TaxID=547442 RepID=A0AAQ3WU92_PASNO
MASSSDDDDSADEVEDIACAFNLLRLLKKRKRGRGHRGSVLGRETIPRPIQEGAERLQKDFFDDPPIYGPCFFRRRFRMRKELFLRIEEALLQYKPTYFKQGRDCTGKLGCSTRQKLAAAIFMLASGKDAFSFDRELRIGESTILEALHEFTRGIVHVFGKKYMRSPNQSTLNVVANRCEARGFPGMLGSLDCMHWVWKSCPSGWKGQYKGHQGEPTVILEAVARTR